MAYFIHNKYDKDSISKVTLNTDGSYTYNDDNSVVVIDYYGLLESDNNTYKSVNTSKIGTDLVDTLEYATINTTALNGNIDITNGLSNNSVKTALFDILMNLDGDIGSSSDLDKSTIFGYLNSLDNSITNIYPHPAYKFTSSNNILYTVINSEVTASTIKQLGQTFKVIGSGTVKITATLKVHDWNTYYEFKVNIFRKSTSTTEEVLKIAKYEQTYTTYTNDITIYDGDEITFTLYGPGGSSRPAYCKLLTISGTKTKLLNI